MSFAIVNELRNVQRHKAVMVVMEHPEFLLDYAVECDLKVVQA
jgi:hypothetical protein